MRENATIMRSVNREMKEALRWGVGNVVKRGHHGVMAATPKDTRFAARRHLGVGGLPNVNPVDKPPGTSFAAVTPSETDAELHKYKLGQDIYSVTEAKYYRFLLRGSSPQAPAGFQETALVKSLRDAAGKKWPGTIL